MSNVTQTLKVNVPPEGLISGEYDYVGATYPDATTEVFVFKRGGASGSVYTTITIIYTDSNKDLIVSAVRT